MAKLDIDLFRDLQEAGFAEKQAEALIRAITDKTTAQLVNKADLAALELKLEKRFTEIDKRFAEIDKQFIDVKNDMLTMEGRIIKWVAGIVVTSNLAMVGAVAMIVALMR